MQTNLPRLGVWFGVAVLAGVWSAMVFAGPVRSDRPAMQAEQKLKPIEGELLRVDTEAMTLEIRATNGVDVRFRYDDRTEVTGAKKDVAGLSTEKGAKVTVHYRVDERPPEKAPAYIATRIDVHGPGR